MMRLKFQNENKIKTCCVMFVLAFVITSSVLFGLRLNVHARDYSQYPLYFGLGSNMGYGVHTQLPDISAIKTYLDNQSGWEDDDLQLVTIHEVSTNYVVFETWSDTLTWNFSGTFPAFGTITLYCPTACSLIKWDISSQSFTQYYNGSRDATLSLTSPVSDNTYILHYPYWALSGNISMGGNTFFIYGADTSSDFSGHSIGGSAEGEYIPSQNGVGGTISLDLDLQYDSTPIVEGFTKMDEDFEGLKIELDAFEILVETIGDGLLALGRGIKDTLDSIKGILQDFTKVPSSSEVSSAIAESEVVGGFTEVTSRANTFVGDVFADYSSEVPSASDMDFDYDFHWQTYNVSTGSFNDNVTPVHIRFSWYENIRTKVLTVMAVFMTVSFIVYIIKQFPNIVNGVSGVTPSGSLSETSKSPKGGKSK